MALSKENLIKLPKFYPKVTDDKLLLEWDFDIFSLGEIEKHRYIWVMFNKLDLFTKY